MQALCVGLLQAAPDPILVCDRAGSIVVANPRCEEEFGYASDELIGQPIEVLIPEGKREGHRRQRAEYADRPRLRRMGTAIEIQARRRDGSEFYADVSLSPLEVDGSQYVICILRDVSEQREADARNRYLSTHDALTGLHNRAYLDEELARLRNSRQFPVAVLVVDLDDFKRVNDSFGHAAGDAVLKRMATLLKNAFRAEDVVARSGGDEFVIILPSTGPDGCSRSVDRLRSLSLQASTGGADSGTLIEFSVGGAVAESGERLEPALRDADRAMYADKAARR